MTCGNAGTWCTGPHDFRVFRRGEKPGNGESLYSLRVLSERDPVRFSTLIEEMTASKNMRKQYVLAVVDDEDELTYYEIKFQKPGQDGDAGPASPGAFRNSCGKIRHGDRPGTFSP